MQIPVYSPYLHGNEKKYVNECLDSTWISSKGKFVGKFEKEFSHYVHIPWATSVANGTVALHLALLAVGLGPGDEVIVPTLNYIASVNAIKYVGATPVFVDSVESTWQMDPEDVRQKITPKTKAILTVHLYGQSCDMDALVAISKQHNLFLIEDCAEALGSFYKNKHVGTFGDIATFSFFGNKTITTGEGGMVVCRDETLLKHCNQLKSQGLSVNRQYWHDIIGYNYRMTNICAAIGLAQLEQIEQILAQKRSIAEFYAEALQGLPLQTHAEAAETRHSYWMCSILVDEAKLRDPLREHLQSFDIETRPVFYPVHTMPMYSTSTPFKIAESLGSRGINLPSWPGLNLEQLNYIVQNIKGFWQ